MTWLAFQLVVLIAITISTSMSNVSGEAFPALNIKKHRLSFEDFELYTPPLSQLAEALSEGLRENYAEVSVKVVDCPDLTASPFNLAAKGLSGYTAHVQVGSLNYLFPMSNYKRVYDLIDIGRNALPNARIFSVYGAGSGPFMVKTQFCEGVYNLKVNEDKSIVNQCRLGYIRLENGYDLKMEKFPANETRMAFLGNMFVSEGKSGKVVQIKAKKRIGGEASFITACRKAVYEAFDWKVVGLGGVFVVKNGTTMQHIGLNFPLKPVKDPNTWKRLFNMPAPLTSVGTFITDDMGLNMQVEHFHSFSNGKWGGHYEYDTNADTIEYEAYFNVAQRAILIDRPN
ncbi:ester hydrolase C11orf54 homolog [Contarinia nasturtii]|uniref:ester hydrolase C11orf54 homolog n=1 Tax=Contarinia nasturtii TaxID=265458 RepID=UPI0012D45DE0|nr:ester hydrolase C11orf54 homolog [Contarinia nasturtii]